MNSEFLLTLYQEQSKMIYYYLRKQGCSHMDAEDIVQERYTKYIVYSNGVQPNKALAYIFRIALNEWNKLLKKRGKEQVLLIDDGFWNNLANDIDIESSLLEKEKNMEVDVILQDLKEIHKQLLIMKYMLEFTYKDIALLLGMKIETVRTYLYRARKEFNSEWRKLYGQI